MELQSVNKYDESGLFYITKEKNSIYEIENTKHICEFTDEELSILYKHCVLHSTFFYDVVITNIKEEIVQRRKIKILKLKENICLKSVIE